MPRELRIKAFDMNCVGHIQQGLWTHPRDQSVRYLDLHYWTEYAKRLEAGGSTASSSRMWWACTVQGIRGQAVRKGRAAGDIKVFLGATVVTGRTDVEAQQKCAEYQRYASSEAALVHAAASLGIDFSSARQAVRTRPPAGQPPRRALPALAGDGQPGRKFRGEPGRNVRQSCPSCAPRSKRTQPLEPSTP